MKKCNFILAAALLISVSCNKSNSTSDDPEVNGDSQSYNAETAMSVVGSASGAVEGTVGLYGLDEIANELQKMDYLDPKTKSVNAAAPCNLSTARSSCSINGSAGVRTVTWNSCAVGTATLSGSWTEVYNDTSCSMSTNGNTMTRMALGSGVVLTGANGATFTTDTSGGTAYDGSTMGSTGVTVAITGSGRSIGVDSIHRVLKGPKGSTWFDYFIKTGTAISVTGAKSTNDRTITSGSLSIYHNRAQYTATHSFSSVVWGDLTCCYPTSGVINSTFSGAVTGSTTMTFTNTCGMATFVDTTGASSAVTLTQCQ